MTVILRSACAGQLDKQYLEKASLKEKKIEETLKERQELFNMAFQQDLQLYKESGIVPMNVRGKKKSISIIIYVSIANYG